MVSHISFVNYGIEGYVIFVCVAPATKHVVFDLTQVLLVGFLL
jgi:hypothetical protein